MAHPWINDADVSRNLPNEISINIVEQRPFAILDMGRKFMINIRGEIFKEWSDSDPGHLPMISGLEYSDLSVAGKLSVSKFPR